MTPASRSRSIAERETFISSKMSESGSGALAELVDQRAIGSRICFARARVDHLGVAASIACALAARGHVRGQRDPQHLAEGRDVVLRGPATELDDLRDERRLVVIEHRADRLELRRVDRRRVEQRDDEAGGELRSERHFDARAEAHAVFERRGDAIGSVPWKPTGTAISANSESIECGAGAAHGARLRLPPPPPATALEIPSSAITFFMSAHTSFFAAGVRSRYAGWYVGMSLMPL